MNCPRCNALTSWDRRRGRLCLNPKCSWPNPEPGIINAFRYRARRSGANKALQALRQKGLWPPIP